MRRLFETLLGLERIQVPENKRVVLLDRGQLADIKGAGEFLMNKSRHQAELHDLAKPDFVSPLEAALFRTRPELAARHLTEVRTGEAEIAVIFRDARAFRVLRPQSRAVLWTDAGPWTIKRVTLDEGLEVETDLARRLTQVGVTDAIAAFEVPDGSVGLMSVEGAFTRILDAGTHRFWGVGRKVTVRLVDTRWRSHDVTGQELLTADRVTLRVNLAADFRVTDPVRATTQVRDFEEALHRALQFAFRKTLGAKTLDTILSEKVTVDAEAAQQVRAEMAEIGLEVGDISLKDVILPGEMRDILNQVVAARHEAEANVIRRREETNATRSLLNTAKVMADNPVMLRLKELEALEVIAGKVERLTVHNGTNGLMSDIAKLTD